jgi:transcription termination factor Rho
MSPHKRQGSGRGHDRAPQPDVAQEAEAIATATEGRRPGLNIGELKDMSIQKLTQVAKELNVPGATGMRKQS